MRRSELVSLKNVTFVCGDSCPFKTACCESRFYHLVSWCVAQITALPHLITLSVGSSDNCAAIWHVAKMHFSNNMETATHNKEDADDDSFVDFYWQHHGSHPDLEKDRQCVKDLKKARKDSREKRQDANFEKKYEQWWKKYGKDQHNLILKEQMRSMACFDKKKK